MWQNRRRPAQQGGRMMRLRGLRRPMWLDAAACVATAVPVAVTVSGEASAGKQDAPVVVDPDYLYGRLYTMSKSFSYRISGADGDPRDAADPFNLPPTVNGWQELVAYWK